MDAWFVIRKSSRDPKRIVILDRGEPASLSADFAVRVITRIGALLYFGFWKQIFDRKDIYSSCL